MLLRELIIYGAGAHAQEMAEIVERLNQVEPTWKLLGFAIPEGHPDPPRDELNGYPVLGGSELFERYADAAFLPEYGSGHLEVARERIASLIAPTAFASRTANIGAGCVIYPNCFVGRNASLGNRVFVLSGSAINHDDRLEDRVTLASGVTLAGGVHVEEECYLGQACSVRQDVHIGRGSLIGMGSMVLADVPPGVVMVGNPARQLRRREEA
jgi:sugar O-acyltransferase (sialic acid O-acetyltransferase NeuD family)